MGVMALAAVVGLTGCVGGGDGPVSADDFPSVVCTVAYRPDLSQAPSSQEVTLEPGGQRTVEHEQLVVDLAYDLDPGEGAALRIDVAPPGADGPRSRDLYQLVAGDPPEEGWLAGGHGFTGLSYVRAPDGAAEIQHFCAVG